MHMEMVSVINDALRETALFCLFCYYASFSDFPVMNTNCFYNKKIYLFFKFIYKTVFFFLVFSFSVPLSSLAP